MSSKTRRARSPEAKQSRSAALLDAAYEIAAGQGVRRVTLTTVTNRVGLHPSALRRYFESTEELLLQLAELGWADWRAHLLAGLGERKDLDPPAAATITTRSLEQLPVFCDLLTHVVLSLEGSVRIERARQYKQAATLCYDAMTDALAQSVHGLDRTGARTTLTVAMSSAAYLYQLSRPAPTLQQLYAEEPQWAHSALRFREQLTELLTAVIQGARVTSCGGPAHESTRLP